MSLLTQAKVVCQKCGKEKVIKIYKSINTAVDPQLKDKVLSGEAFLWECPQCGQSNLIAYECLYHDPDNKIMIWMLPFGEPQGAEKEAITNQVRAMGDYKLRIVENAGDLMEKVMIFEAGLDDRCMELVKYIAGQEVEGVSNMHFYRVQDDNMVFSGVKEGKMDGVCFGLNVYEDCAGILKRNPDIAKEDGFAHIDQSWVAEMLK